MIQTTIARRYAKALFDLAKEEGKTDQFRDLLKQLSDLFVRDQSLKFILANRYFDLTARMNVMKQIAAKMEFGETLTNFMRLLIQKGRMDFFNFILAAYQQLVYEDESKVEAVVVSARPLSDGAYQKIEDTMSRMTGKTVVSTRKIEPGVVGGISVRVAGKIYDGTIRSELDRMKLQLNKLSV